MWAARSVASPGTKWNSGPDAKARAAPVGRVGTSTGNPAAIASTTAMPSELTSPAWMNSVASS
jgi:hypothetical protein